MEEMKIRDHERQVAVEASVQMAPPRTIEGKVESLGHLANEVAAMASGIMDRIIQPRPCGEDEDYSKGEGLLGGLDGIAAVLRHARRSLFAIQDAL